MITYKTWLLLGLLLLVLGNSVSLADTVSWTSTNFVVAGDSIVGRSHTAYDRGIPGIFRSIESRDQDSTSGTVLPIPGPTDTDTFTTSVVLDNGGLNWRQASTLGNLTGNPSSTISTYNGAGALAKNTNLNAQTIKTEGVGTTTFTGQFISTGAMMTFTYDGVYDLFSFYQNNLLPYQRAESALSVALTVKNLTTSGTLVNQTLFTDSLIRTSYGVSRKDDVAISGTQDVDLSGTSGNTIELSLVTTARATTYAHRRTNEPSSYGAAGASASANFDEFNFNISVVPEPSTVTLLVVGLLAAGKAKRTHSKRRRL